MSDQAIKETLAALKPEARKVHDAAKIIAADGKPINDDWIEDIGDATKIWERCTIKIKVRAPSETRYTEWVDITLDDGTVLLSSRYYIGSSSIDFDLYAFRNGAWADRLIKYSIEGVMAEKEKQKKAELEKKLKPFSEIDF
jgi:hypothetical protein